MITIYKAQSNQITVTLTEKCDLMLPHFLFYFRNQMNGDEVSKVLTDTSQFTDRYNRFTFVEPTTAELIEGFWDYEVYEQASASNTDRTGLNMVESGVMKVIDNTTPQEPTVYDSQPTTRTVYEQ